MIKNLNINGVHFDVDNDLHKYIGKKIGILDKFVGRKARPAIKAEVMLKEKNAKNKKDYTCEVILHLPQETIAVSESTINMYAAVDIVENKLRNQLKKYKDKHDKPRLIRHLAGRLQKK